MTKPRTIYGAVKGYKEDNQTERGAEGVELYKYRTFNNKWQIAKGLQRRVARTHSGEGKVHPGI
jgi:hypothetical protein